MKLEDLPHMVFADEKGRVYDHPHYRMTGFSGSQPQILGAGDLVPFPEFSKLFFIPGCPPVGLDPSTGQFDTVTETTIDRIRTKCYAVAAFLEPGILRSHLPGTDYRNKSYTLPTWAYTAVGFNHQGYWAAGFRIEYNPKWDPRNYDDRELMPAIQAFRRERMTGPLVEHLIDCATRNHCFAAKNLFLQRWEAPLPISRSCNAACLGCLSLQPEGSFQASHARLSFRPSKEEIVHLAVRHLNRAPEAIVSFGQGCEGEPLTDWELLSESIHEIRQRTGLGTINLNTNGSWPKGVRMIIENGLDSIRISMNSAQPELYRAYFRPRNYDFEDVMQSIGLSKEAGLYTMINYLVFPGVTDRKEEIEALSRLIERTGVDFIHFKNLNIDPQLYLQYMPESKTPVVGMKKMVTTLREEFPDLQVGYFNRPLR